MSDLILPPSIEDKGLKILTIYQRKLEYHVDKQTAMKALKIAYKRLQRELNPDDYDEFDEAEERRKKR